MSQAILQELAPFMLEQILIELGTLSNDEHDPAQVIDAAQDLIHDLAYNNLVSQASIVKWGERGQANQATEECAELIVALNKFFNRDHNSVGIDEVITEVADVEIMMDCLRFCIGSEKVTAEKNRKLERLGTERLGLKSRFDYQFGYRTNSLR